MKNIVIFTAYYLPGYKGGGPIKSIQSIVNALKDQFNFYIITSDRDLGDTVPYNNINKKDWNGVDGAKVFYTSGSLLNPKNIKLIKTLLFSMDIDLYYFNGIFNLNYSVIPLFLLKLRLIENSKVLIAPRGELDEGALSIKIFKKTFFLYCMNKLGIYNNVSWHATSIEEQKNILKYIDKASEPSLAKNLSLMISQKNNSYKKKGELNIVFLSRITEKKNLDYALTRIIELSDIIDNYKIIFHIYGTQEDENYWKKCKAIMDSNIHHNIYIEYKGTLLPETVSMVLSRYQLFFFPTKGENFGHVIIEALNAGVPVLLSTNTPWNDVREYGCGWTIDLDNKDYFIKTLYQFICMENDEWTEISNNTTRYLEKRLNQECILNDTKKMFITAML